MSLLVANNLTKFYGSDEIFRDVSAEVPHGARIALVGPNGAGKTTLINILIGHDIPTDGTLTRAKDIQMGFLPQNPELVGEHTLWEEQLRAFAHLRKMEARLRQLEADMANPDRHDEAIAEYGPLQAEYELLGGYEYETRIRMVLGGVGFGEADYHMPLSKLSGGQKTRALLARLLLSAPDLLVLDEPTNHLDIQAVEWLEDFLSRFQGAVVAVSHDRYFMDNFAQTIWELEFGHLEIYRGNYSHYIQQRDERRERLLKEYEAQQAFIAKEEAYIRKHMGSRWTAQAKGRQKKLETMKRRGKIIFRPQNRKSMALNMQAELRSGDKVLMTRDLAIGYHDDGQVLLRVPDIVLLRGETAALIGPNGVGKSTFLKTITQKLPPLSGEVGLGANVKIGYFAQAHEELNPDNSILDEILAIKPMPISEARNFLGRFLFSGDDVFRPVRSLSGGERGRVALAKLALSGANLLLLDEPTNHLDIDSQEILQAVLEDFSGTILLVSHDRYLVSALATQIWAAQPGELDVFEGTYAEYVAYRNRRMEQAAQKPSGSADTPNVPANADNTQTLNPYQRQKRLAEVEARITTLEESLRQLTTEIERESAAGNSAKVAELGALYTETERHLEAIMAEWELLAE